MSRYIEWRGGGRFHALSSYRAEGRIETDGLSGTVSVQATTGGSFRQDIDLGPVKRTIRIHGKWAWQSTLSGQVEALSDADRMNALSDGTAALGGPSDEVNRVTIAGKEAIGGVSCDILRRIRGGGRIDYLLAKDGRLVATRSTSNGETRTTRYADWRRVGRVRVAFSTIETGLGPGDRTIVRYSDVVLNGPMDAAAFERPPSVNRLAFGPGGSSGWIAYEFFGGTRIFIPAKVACLETSVLLDSGAEATVLDGRFAAAHGLNISGTTTAQGTGGASRAGLVSGVSIRIGDMTLKDLTVAAIDLANVEKQLGHPLPVVLGVEIFRESVVDIDFAHRRIAFLDPARFAPPQDGRSIPVTRSGGLYTIPAMIDGRPATLDLDLGSGSPLFLYPRFWRQSPKVGARASTTLLGGVGGLKEAGIATVARVQVGTSILGPLPVELHAPQDGADSGRSDGNLGLPLLSRFHLIVDLPHQRVWLVGAGDTTTPFRKDRSGLALLPGGGGAQVLHVGTGSPAQKLGLKVGDSIVTIDDASAGSPGIGDWRSAPPGTAYRLGLADGRKVTLVLADYF
ncbi:aspartyl protease family protein [Sphingomonas antarctica]|uniref:aspartyl protease family protein n=1 Tax=Sphingomonas antarctica TaxID=2040274 RepID=UPI0039E83EDF